MKIILKTKQNARVKRFVGNECTKQNDNNLTNIFCTKWLEMQFRFILFSLVAVAVHFSGGFLLDISSKVNTFLWNRKYIIRRTGKPPNDFLTWFSLPHKNVHFHARPIYKVFNWLLHNLSWARYDPFDFYNFDHPYSTRHTLFIL